MSEEPIQCKSACTSPRVLMVISLFFPHLGGAEQQALALAKALKTRGISVHVLTRKTEGLAARQDIEGIPVFRSIRILNVWRFFGITYMLSVLYFIYKRRHDYDIIHCHLAQGLHCPVALLFKRFFHKKVIIKVGATGPLSDFIVLRGMLFGRFFLNRLNSADRLVTICEQSRNEAATYGLECGSTILIPNGVDVNKFKPSVSDARSNRITFVGRLDRMKGIPTLLEAFRLLGESEIGAHLDIIGEGPDRSDFEKLAEQKGLTGAVHFRGAVPDVTEVLADTAVLVLPSLSEGLPNVILEAMACGIPVVATRVGGTVDIITDGADGILVDPENSVQLCTALIRLLHDHDYARRMGARAARTVRERFSLDAVAGQYVSLYNQLIESSAEGHV